MRTRHIVSAVIEKENMLLFGRKAEGKGPYPNTWHLLGGGIEDGEATASALQREVKEESNINIKVVEDLGVDEDNEPNKHGELTHYVFHVFRATYVGGEITPSDDIVELRWFPRGNLPEDLPRPSVKLFKRLGYRKSIK